MHPEWNIHELARATGVMERHVISPGEVSSGFAVKCAGKLFADNQISPLEIDFIMFCSLSPDYITPATACTLQYRLGISKNCGAMDYNLGCTGFMYGLMVAKGLVESGSARNVLILNSDSVTQFLHPLDKSTWSIFGDGASATLVSLAAEESSSEIGRFVYGTDGSGYSNIIIRNGGAVHPETGNSPDFSDQYGNICNDDHLFMNGTSVFMFSTKTAPLLINNLLEKNDMKIEDIDLFIFHQASGFILETIAKKLHIKEEKCYVNIAEVGNNGSATIPIALHQALQENRIKHGDRVVLASFGVGYSWVGTIIKY